MIQGRTSLPVAIYLRVSTDTQTTENQRIALEVAATARGWNVVRVYQDHGISGAKGRDKRPGLDALLKDAAKGDFRLVAAWSVDRLGRSLPPPPRQPKPHAFHQPGFYGLVMRVSDGRKDMQVIQLPVLALSDPDHLRRNRNFLPVLEPPFLHNRFTTV